MTANSNKKSVLIVDDNLDNLKLLADILRESDFDIRQITNSTQALRTATVNPPDLFLLDIMMPGMDGLELCNVLKEREDLRDIPVIFLTALSDTTNKLKAFTLGGVDYIEKPFSAEEVLARVNSHINNQQKFRQLEKDIHFLEEKIQGQDIENPSQHQTTVDLTQREKECLSWLARGLKYEMIADKLGIKPVTVEMHISNARKKLAASTREQALAMAIHFGLVNP